MSSFTSQLKIISKESCFVSAVSTENCTAKWMLLTLDAMATEERGAQFNREQVWILVQWNEINGCRILEHQLQGHHYNDNIVITHSSLACIGSIDCADRGDRGGLLQLWREQRRPHHVDRVSQNPRSPRREGAEFRCECDLILHYMVSWCSVARL